MLVQLRGEGCVPLLGSLNLSGVIDLVSCMCNSQVHLHFHFVSFVCSLCILILLDFPHLLCFMRLYIFFESSLLTVSFLKEFTF